MCDTSIEFYIPDALIGQCCSQEYFNFLMAKMSLDNINDFWIRDYLVNGEKEWQDSDEYTEEEWTFMIDESGLKKAYDNLVIKVKEITDLKISMVCFPGAREVLGDYTKDLNIIINKCERDNITMWTADEYFNIDKVLKFINILGYDSFEASGIKLVSYEY